jgi:hypothetical protein
MVRIVKNILKDMVDQAWTLLGMFIAWVVLDGSAKTIVGCINGYLSQSEIQFQGDRAI